MIPIMKIWVLAIENRTRATAFLIPDQGELSSAADPVFRIGANLDKSVRIQ